MRTAKPSTCRKCKRICQTISEVWICPYCGATNIGYIHIVNDITVGVKALTKMLKK